MSAGQPGFDLVVGLGNPGPAYEQTRHNVGFWWLDELAARHRCSFKAESRHGGEVCRIRLGSHEPRLLKPMTFMNRSGQAVQSLAAFFRLPPERILVAHDDLDLPAGSVRLKKGGGHGGHNGLRDIIARLGKEFYRLRIGIGHPGHKDMVTDYVLGRPPAIDREAIERALTEAADAFPAMLEGQLDRAMQRLHTLK